ncbi:preprotein translocase subunit Tim44 [Leptolyngbya sp. 'hensonii']|uniref:alpha-keto acid decarboxylase family protein n=1 Tax=Leptolyngbya sp. 'hensonii' TaxID=1922337 RepID=UPI00095004DA|nr:thiamine pyrophosphate-binding protein [Leptolyngbya sp. 'hensonii']OLP15892.1 preprotein translocase subunit Tim44 [Leptolyngbya sp. 'hensonii']
MWIGNYLIQRLYDQGVRHVFGVPGDFVLGFDKLLEESSLIEFVNTCDEQGAGFAADAYARLQGLGAVCITYCVGGLKVANTTAQAYAEKSPVIVISGSPGMDERVKNPLLHHKVREFDTQFKVFQQLTVASTVIDRPDTAFQEIDRVIAAALRYKQPVYIELPRNLVHQPGHPNYQWAVSPEPSDENALKEALEEALTLINQAHRPVILAGVELHRFGLQDSLMQLVEKTNIPVAVTLLSKSVFNEQHPCYLGIYAGAMGHPDIQHYVETSDCLILLGAFMTDLDLGGFTAHLDPKRSIKVTNEKTLIQYHTYEDIRLQDFMQGLIAAPIRPRPLDLPQRVQPSLAVFPLPEQKITLQRLFDRLNRFIDDNTIVIADPGDALFAGVDLLMHHHTEFLSPAYYASLGFAVPASLGTQLAKPNLRPLVLVGDGAFQMTGMELSTIARYHLNPIVIVINNQGYATERPMQDGKFNDILNWKYSRLPELLGTGVGFEVTTEVELEEALLFSRMNQDSFCILDVQIDATDVSMALKQLTGALGAKVRSSQSTS